MKESIENLAVFGGNPSFAEILHVGRPNIPDRQRLMERINDILDSRWLTNNGPVMREFEQRVSELLGVRHCIAMCNGTVAQEIAVRALGMKGEVIIPSFTFIATAHALQWQEINPVFCDIDPDTHNMDPDRVEQLITPRTTGVIGVHVWGRPCNVDALTAIAKRHNLRLLFDAAHAFGCSYKGRMIGGFGDAEFLSFHATKFLNTFEGGAVVTNDDGLAEKIRLMKNFGFAGLDNVIHLGTNGKMSEVSAAMGLTSLENLDELVETNMRNYHAYASCLKGVLGISLIRYDENEKGNFQYIVLEMDEKKTGVSRDNLMKILHAENVRARRYFYPCCHRMEPYHSIYPDTGLLLPETEKLSKRVLCLPTGTAVNPEDIQRICSIIRFIVENNIEIQTALQKNKIDC
jgi:dTDP-4-amino-4,6-dideoxygalactose transaminase